MIAERVVTVFGLSVTLLLDTDTMEYTAKIANESRQYEGHGHTWQEAVDGAVDAYVEAESEATT